MNPRPLATQTARRSNSRTRSGPGRDVSRSGHRSSALLAAATILMVGSSPDRVVAAPVLPPPYVVAGLLADTIGVLDPATDRVTENYASATYPSPAAATLTRAGTGLVAQPGIAGASLSLTYGPAPAATASAYSGITGVADPTEKFNPVLAYGYGSYEGFANSKVFYSLEFSGPKPTVMIDIAAVLRIAASGITADSYGIASAGIAVYDSGDYAVFQDALENGPGGTMFLHTGNGVTSNTPVSFSTYTESGAYIFNTGQIYDVVVGATADALTLGSLTDSSDAASAFGSIDPTFAIDPAMLDADAYSIVLSEGIGNSAVPIAAVPEPPTVALLFAGLGFVAFGARRTRPPSRNIRPSTIARTD